MKGGSVKGTYNIIKSLLLMGIVGFLGYFIYYLSVIIPSINQIVQDNIPEERKNLNIIYALLSVGSIGLAIGLPMVPYIYLTGKTWHLSLFTLFLLCGSMFSLMYGVSKRADLNTSFAKLPNSGTGGADGFLGGMGPSISKIDMLTIILPITISGWIFLLGYFTKNRNNIFF
jgi:hypothetical protein